MELIKRKPMHVGVVAVALAVFAVAGIRWFGENVPLRGQTGGRLRSHAWHSSECAQGVDLLESTLNFVLCSATGDSPVTSDDSFGELAWAYEYTLANVERTEGRFPGRWWFSDAHLAMVLQEEGPEMHAQYLILLSRNGEIDKFVHGRPYAIMAENSRFRCGDGLTGRGGPICGNGVVDPGEECGEPGLVCPRDDSVCVDCRCVPLISQCGDGVVDPGEECDHGADNSDTEPDACRTDCTLPRCGDGVADSGEECGEPGLVCTMTAECVGCRCMPVLAQCGDGVLDPGEECDYGGVCRDGTTFCTSAADCPEGDPCRPRNSCVGADCRKPCHDTDAHLHHLKQMSEKGYVFGDAVYTYDANRHRNIKVSWVLEDSCGTHPTREQVHEWHCLEGCTSGICNYYSVYNCPADHVCRDGACVPGKPQCTSDRDCDDSDPCTHNICDQDTKLCTHPLIYPLPPECGACSDSSDCSAEEICTHVLCGPDGCRRRCCDVEEGVCDVFTSTCSFTLADNCCITSADCDDGNPCTINRCNGSTNLCESIVLPDCQTCSDSRDCPAPDTPCEEAFCFDGLCKYRPVPECCMEDYECDDDDPCTDDRCIDNHCSNITIPGCGAALCGNGVLDPGEECDDGNDQNEDGCSEHCTIEVGWSCDTSVQPSRCAVIVPPIGGEDDDYARCVAQGDSSAEEGCRTCLEERCDGVSAEAAWEACWAYCWDISVQHCLDQAEASRFDTCQLCLDDFCPNFPENAVRIFCRWQCVDVNPDPVIAACFDQSTGSQYDECYDCLQSGCYEKPANLQNIMDPNHSAVRTWMEAQFGFCQHECRDVSP